MTCIVGLIDNGKVWMGADSAAICGDQIQTIKESKIIKINNQMLIGYSGSIRCGQLLRYKEWLPVYCDDETVMQYMCTVFVDHYIQLLKDNYYFENKQEDDYGDCLLCGIGGRLFQVDCEFQVVEFDKEYAAIGSGAEYALGSLESIISHSYHICGEKTDSFYILQEALRVSAEFAASVQDPFNIECI